MNSERGMLQHYLMSKAIFLLESGAVMIHDCFDQVVDRLGLASLAAQSVDSSQNG